MRGRRCIMEVEVMPVVATIFAEKSCMRGRDGYWYLDNVAALSGFI